EEGQPAVTTDDGLGADESPELGLQFLGTVDVTVTIYKNPAEPQKRQLPNAVLDGQGGQAGVQVIAEAAVHGTETPAEWMRVEVATKMTVGEHPMRTVGVGQKGHVGHLEHHRVLGHGRFDPCY